MKRILMLLCIASVIALPLNVEARHHSRKQHVVSHHKHASHHVAKAKTKAKAKHSAKKRKAKVSRSTAR